MWGGGRLFGSLLHSKRELKSVAQLPSEDRRCCKINDAFLLFMVVMIARLSRVDQLQRGGFLLLPTGCWGRRRKEKGKEHASAPSVSDYHRMK